MQRGRRGHALGSSWRRALPNGRVLAARAVCGRGSPRTSRRRRVATEWVGRPSAAHARAGAPRGSHSPLSLFQRPRSPRHSRRRARAPLPHHTRPPLPSCLVPLSTRSLLPFPLRRVLPPPPPPPPLFTFRLLPPSPPSRLTSHPGAVYTASAALPAVHVPPSHGCCGAPVDALAAAGPAPAAGSLSVNGDRRGLVCDGGQDRMQLR